MREPEPEKSRQPARRGVVPESHNGITCGLKTECQPMRCECACNESDGSPASAERARQRRSGIRPTRHIKPELLAVGDEVERLATGRVEAQRPLGTDGSKELRPVRHHERGS